MTIVITTPEPVTTTTTATPVTTTTTTPAPMTTTTVPPIVNEENRTVKFTIKATHSVAKPYYWYLEGEGVSPDGRGSRSRIRTGLAR